MGFDEHTYGKVLRKLLSESPRERRAADGLLFMLLAGQETDGDGRWQGLIRGAIEGLGGQTDSFLAALIAFWAQRAELQLRERMTGFGGKPMELPATDWKFGTDSEFPLREDMPVTVIDMYGLGVARLLEGIGPAAAACVPGLRACLKHPDPMVVDAATHALGSIGAEARPALDALLQCAGESHWGQPFPPGIAVARIAGGDEDLWVQIARVAVARDVANGMSGVCRVLTHMQAALPDVIDLVRDALESRREPQAAAVLLRTGAQLTGRDGHSADNFVEYARAHAGEPDNELKTAVVTVLGMLGDPKRDTRLLLDYLCLDDCSVRIDTLRALTNWRAVPESLLKAAARDIGNFDCCDGEPHDTAIAVLTAAGENASLALDEIKRFVNEVADEPYDFDHYMVTDLVDLLQALGGNAAAMTPELERLGHAYHKMLRERLEDEDDFEEDGLELNYDDLPKEASRFVEAFPQNTDLNIESDVQSNDSLRLAVELGISIEDDIPGTEHEFEHEQDEGLPIAERLRTLLDELKA